MFRDRRGGKNSSVMFPGPFVFIALCLTALSFWGFVQSRATQQTDVSQLSSPDSTVVDRLQAALRIAESGTAGVPEILDALNHPNLQVRRVAAYALSQTPRITRDQERTLHRNLGSPDPLVRRSVLLALIKRCEDNPQKLRLAMKMFADRNERVSRVARDVIKDVGPAAVPALLDASGSRDAVIRRNAARSLRLVGIENEAITEAARRLLADDDNAVRYDALVSIKAMGALDRQDLVDAVMSGIEGDDYRTSRFVLEQTEIFRKSTDGELIESLVLLLESSHSDIRLLSALRLAEIGSAAHTAVPALQRLFDSTNGSPRVLLADALAAVGAEPGSYVPVLRELVFDKTHEDAACLAAMVLAKHAPTEASELLPRIVKNLRHSNFDERYIAAAAILGLGSTAEPVVESLIQVCRDSDPEVVAMITLAFGQMESAAELTMPFLMEQIRRSLVARESFLLDLAPFGMSISEPLAGVLPSRVRDHIANLRPEMVQLVQHCRASDPTAAAIESLGRIGRGNGEAFGVVLSVVDHPSRRARGAAIVALEEMQGDSVRTLAALKKLAASGDYGLSMSAMQATERLKK